MAQRPNEPQTVDEIAATRDELLKMAKICDALLKSMDSIGVTRLPIIGHKRKNAGLKMIRKWLDYAPLALSRTKAVSIKYGFANGKKK